MIIKFAFPCLIYIPFFQVITKPLTVDEGSEDFLGPEHLELSDVDSVPETVYLELQTEPEHGVLHIGGYPLTPGQNFTLQDLIRHKVRSDILFDSNIQFMGNCRRNTRKNIN